jgi:hypothetical protein
MRSFGPQNEAVEPYVFPKVVAGGLQPTSRLFGLSSVGAWRDGSDISTHRHTGTDRTNPSVPAAAGIPGCPTTPAPIFADYFSIVDN